MRSIAVVHVLAAIWLVWGPRSALAYDPRQGNLACADCHEEGAVEEIESPDEFTPAPPAQRAAPLAAAEGAGWSLGENVSNTPTGSELCSNQGKALVVDGAGRVHAVWHDRASGSWEVHHAVRSPGGGWTATQVSPTDGRTSVYPAVAADAQGRVFAVWEDYQYSPGGFVARPEVFLSVWEGATWSPPRLISATAPGLASSWYASVAVGTDDRVTVLWQDRRLGTDHAVFRGDDQGEVGLVAADGTNPSVGAGGGRVLAAWQTKAGAVVGQELGTGAPQTLAAAGRHASVHVNATGTGAAVWNTPAWDVGVAGYEHGAWGTSGQAGFSNAYYPSVAVDAQGTTHVAFGYGSVAYATCSGATWTGPEPIQPAAAYLPILTAGANALHLAYIDTSAGNSEIYYRKRPLATRNPVLYIPGIMVSKLYDGPTRGDLVWASLWDFILGIGDDFLDPLELDPLASERPVPDGIKAWGGDPGSSLKVTDWVGHLMMPKEYLIFGQRFQENFYDTMRAAGYPPHQGSDFGDLSFFAYDWRLAPDHALVQTAEHGLAARIQTLRDATGGGPVDVVAHSLGGLVLKQYLSKVENRGKIDKAVIIGTPHLGAAKAFGALQFGDLELGVLSSLVTSQKQFMKISQNWPVSYALSPSPALHTLAGYGPSFEELGVDLNQDGQMTAWDWDEIQSYYNGGQYYRNWWTVPVPDPDRRHNGRLAVKSKDLHAALDPLNQWAGNAGQVVLIAGQQKFTTETLLLTRNDPEDERWPNAWYLDARGVSGDGTVPTRSASLEFDPWPGNIQRYYVRGVEHDELLDEPGVAALITWLLRGEVAQRTLPPHIQDRPFPDTLSLWEINFRSPVEPHVYDAAGNHLGPLPNRAVERGIPGASYRRQKAPDGHVTTIHLPLGGPYRIEILSQGSGSFRMTVRTIQGDVITRSAIYDRVPLRPETRGSVELGELTAIPTLSLDLDGDGAEDHWVAPSTVLAADERDDRTPPTTAMGLTGDQGQKAYYLSPVTVILTAQDDPGGSGVRATKYTLDGGTTWTPYEAPFVLAEGRLRDLGYRSQDYNFQVEPAKTASVRIDRQPPVIASFAVTPNLLWPPNHRLVEVVPTVSVTDNCTASVPWIIESIRMNEGDRENTYDPAHDQWLEQGFASDDIQVQEGRIYLRAERTGRAAGRIYTLILKATDEAGHVTRAEAQVVVPHDQR